MTTLVLNKPCGVLSQFSGEGERATLARYVDVPGVYPAGRLDADSEGLLVLTDDGALQARITQPGSRRRAKVWKTYLAQVEGEPPDTALAALAEGITLKDGPTRPARVRQMTEPDWLWPRDPPIRHRANIPTAWIELALCEGRNRQVRRMTAAVGHPTLRLIRCAVGGVALDGLGTGQWREIDPACLFAPTTVDVRRRR